MKYIRIGMWSILATTAVTALAQTPITTCPFNINAPGNYVLNADLICGDTGITITANNVSLKLNGHKITAPSSGNLPKVAIDVGGESIGRVHHVGIHGPGLIVGNEGLNAAISLTAADYSQVSQVTIVKASGINGGIYTSNCTFLTLASNVVGRSHGVIILGTSFSSVTGNDLSGNDYGIYMSGGSDNIVNNNVANGNSVMGISININNGTRVYGNTANGNGWYGIAGSFVTGQVFSNTSKANGTFDLFDENTCSGSWSDNTFFTANASCIR